MQNMDKSTNDYNTKNVTLLVVDAVDEKPTTANYENGVNGSLYFPFATQPITSEEEISKRVKHVMNTLICKNLLKLKNDIVEGVNVEMEELELNTQLLEKLANIQEMMNKSMLSKSNSSNGDYADSDTQDLKSRDASRTCDKNLAAVQPGLDRILDVTEEIKRRIFSWENHWENARTNFKTCVVAKIKKSEKKRMEIQNINFSDFMPEICVEKIDTRDGLPRLERHKVQYFE